MFLSFVRLIWHKQRHTISVGSLRFVYFFRKTGGTFRRLEPLSISVLMLAAVRHVYIVNKNQQAFMSTENSYVISGLALCIFYVTIQCYIILNMYSAELLFLKEIHVNIHVSRPRQ